MLTAASPCEFLTFIASDSSTHFEFEQKSLNSLIPKQRHGHTQPVVWNFKLQSSPMNLRLSQQVEKYFGANKPVISLESHWPDVV
jgi:hypothetical protein